MEEKKIKILYVEDNPGQGYLLQKALENSDIAIDWVDTYEKGLNKGQEDGYDLYVIDYVLGNFNGIDLINELNKQKKPSPSLILTASGNEEVAVQALKSGAYDYVIKDVDANYLELMPTKIYKVLSAWQSEMREKEYHDELKLAESVFENSIEGILVTDVNGVIKKVNPSFAKTTGYSAEEAIGKKPNILRSDRHSTAFYKDLWKSILNDGEWQGEIWNRRKNGEVYPQHMTITAIKNNEGKTVQFSSIFYDITELKRNEEDMKHRAYHDALTDLPNRLLFEDRIHMALNRVKRHHGHQIAIMFMDLDGFKAVNDSYGHGTGDELLQEVAQRLSKIMREEDTVSRLGGDEFTMLFQEIDGRKDMKQVAERILSSISAPFLIKDKNISVGISIGISLYPDDGDTKELLMKKADDAMYEVKKSGKNSYAFFDEAS
ncbi:MAG: diguanylate cyclase [Nitrospinae bacterium]|nr:diguanylate cyclase [Nitrospinota bacterium]